MRRPPFIFVLAAFLVALTYQSIAQNKTLDSLNRLLINAKSDREKLRLLNELYLEDENDARAIMTANKAVALASKLKDQNELAKSLNNIALSYFNRDMYSDAIIYLERAYKISAGNNDIQNQNKSLLYLGRSYYEIGKYKESLSFLREQLKLVPEVEDQVDILMLYNTLGGLFYDQGDLSRAHEYYMKELQLAEKIKQDTYIAQSYNNLATVFDAQKKYDKALEYYLKDLEITKKLGDEEDLSLSYNNIGDIYLNMKEYEKAKPNIEKAIEIAERLNYRHGLSVYYHSLASYYLGVGDKEKALVYFEKDLEHAKNSANKFNLAVSYQGLGEFYLNYNKPANAEIRFREALALGKELEALTILSGANKGLAQVYELKGDFANAYKHHKLYKLYYDSVYTSEGEKTIAELNARFESDKKEQTIELLNKEKLLKNNEIKKQKLIRYSFTVGFILMLIVLFMVYQSYRIKQKANILLASQKNEIEIKNNELHSSKNELQKQKDLVDEKQKEIVDSINYAKRIQYSLLAHDEFLKEHLREFFILYKPKDIVSGDFYWATNTVHSGHSPSGENTIQDHSILNSQSSSLNSQLFYLAVCDSTGHGVPGAFMSLLNIGYLSEAINEKKIVRPDEVLNYVRKRLIENISKEDQKDGFDGILICIDKAAKKITYSSANTAAVIVHNNSLTELETDKMPVGVGEKKGEFSLFELPYLEGATLYMYTDGFADQFGGPRGKKFKYRQLNELILECSRYDMSTQKKMLNERFENWKGDLEQVDDVCVIGFKTDF